MCFKSHSFSLAPSLNWKKKLWDDVYTNSAGETKLNIIEFKCSLFLLLKIEQFIYIKRVGDKFGVGLEQDPESSETKPSDWLLCSFFVGLVSPRLGTHSLTCAPITLFSTSASLSYNEHGYLSVGMDNTL